VAQTPLIRKESSSKSNKSKFNNLRKWEGAVGLQRTSSVVGKNHRNQQTKPKPGRAERNRKVLS